MNTRYGNFLKNPFLFDNDLFGISPREARSVDPQQRVLLQTAYRALEDAGYVPDSTPSFARDTFGCFIGSATLDYVDNLRAEIDVYYSPGESHSLSRHLASSLTMPGRNAPRFPEWTYIVLLWLEWPVYHTGHSLLFIHGSTSPGGASVGSW
jgi:acyl transferase domain-containing protein